MGHQQILNKILNISNVSIFVNGVEASNVVCDTNIPFVVSGDTALSLFKAYTQMEMDWELSRFWEERMGFAFLVMGHRHMSAHTKICITTKSILPN